MCNAFNGVRQRVREIVCRVNTPFVADALMFDKANAIQNGVAQINIGRLHINFCAQHFFAFFKFTGAHALKQIAILVNRAFAPRTVFAGFCQGAARCAQLVGVKVAHIRVSAFYELHGKVKKLFEVIRSVGHLVPFKPQPFNVVLYRLRVMRRLLFRIGVVKAQIASPLEFARKPKVEAY